MQSEEENEVADTFMPFVQLRCGHGEHDRIPIHFHIPMKMNILYSTLKATLLLTVCGLSSCGGGGKARVPTDSAGNPASPGGSGHPVPSPTPPSAPPPPALPPFEPPSTEPPLSEPTPPSPTPS
ncbi:hypothetical protein, partial [Lysobacter enzymogenes]